MTSGRKAPLAPLTSLRFFAAASIVIYHLQVPFGYSITGINFGIGISFFYVLSGFILCYVYDDIDSAGQTARFYVARVARIWPLHIATLLFAASFLHPGVAVQGLGTFVANALLLQSWWPSLRSAFSYNAVAWSISDEAFFYLVFPLLMLGRRHFGAIFFGCLAFLLAVFLIGGNLGGPPAEPWAIASWYSFVHFGPPVRFFEFLSGVGFGLLYLRCRDRRLPLWAWTALELLAVAAVAAVALTTERAAGLLIQAGFGKLGTFWYVYSGSVPMVGLAVLCFAFGGGLLSRVLSLRLLVLLGEISFATYMIHQLLLRLWSEQGWAHNRWDPLGLLVILAVIYGGSYLSWRYFERRAQRAILSLGARPGRPAAEPAR